MRRTRFPVPRGPLVLLLMLLAASCGDGGGGDPIAAPHELRLTIVRGKGMRVPVRPVGAPAGEVVLSDEPVIVEVSALIGANREAGAGGTGPSLEARMPPIELRWRALQTWCEPLNAVTPLTRGDTVHNYYRRGTLADNCQMVVEGVSNGWVFDADTALVVFDPGPLVKLGIAREVWTIIGYEFSKNQQVGGGEDAYGNEVPDPPATWTLLEGHERFVLSDTAIIPKAEGFGAAHVVAGAFERRVELWSMPDLVGRPQSPLTYRITWGCDGVPLPGGARADSVRFVMETATATRGGGSPAGWHVSFLGRARIREWRPGEPVREWEQLGYTVIASQRPFELQWDPGQVSSRTPTGYAGASLCQQSYLEPVAGFVPVRVDRS